MAEYTYSQLSQMQKEAVERVREMRRRAKFAAEDAAKQFDAPQVKNTASGPPQQADQSDSVAGKDRPCCRRQMGKKDHPAVLPGMKGMQIEDADRALVLSLCFLLQAEKADEELILAMLYILT